MPSDPAAPQLTVLLAAAARGDRAAFDRAYAVLYDELAVLARAQRRRWVGNDTMSTTVLVHEAYLKLLGDGRGDGGDDGAADDTPGDARWQGRRHFFALAAQVMRQLLVNYAERQSAAKRGGAAAPVPLAEVEERAGGQLHTPDADALADRAPLSPDEAEEILALHAALRRLEARAPRQARIVECRFFAGLSIPDTAQALGISAATVKREWSEAQRWLAEELSSGELRSG